MRTLKDRATKWLTTPESSESTSEAAGIIADQQLHINELEDVLVKAERLLNTAPVDDDFPEVMFHFDAAVRKLTKRGQSNG